MRGDNLHPRVYPEPFRKSTPGAFEVFSATSSLRLESDLSQTDHFPLFLSHRLTYLSGPADSLVPSPLPYFMANQFSGTFSFNPRMAAMPSVGPERNGCSPELTLGWSSWADRLFRLFDIGYGVQFITTLITTLAGIYSCCFNSPLELQCTPSIIKMASLINDTFQSTKQTISC